MSMWLDCVLHWATVLSAENRPEDDAVLVRALKAAGAIVFAKTTMPVTGMVFIFLLSQEPLLTSLAGVRDNKQSFRPDEVWF